VKISGFDHLVLAVADVERSIAWYRDVLGLEESRVDEWRRGEAPFPSVRINAESIVDLIPGQAITPTHTTARNLDHICLVVEPTDLADWAKRARLAIVDGPGPRFGAQGIGTSIYVQDPDGNTIELRYYGDT
jgi:catechol 2,3-dioxygenase-like lactoylglutathione lyase family enzyme